jgi:hypothetical protein
VGAEGCYRPLSCLLYGTFNPTRTRRCPRGQCRYIKQDGKECGHGGLNNVFKLSELNPNNVSKLSELNRNNMSILSELDTEDSGLFIPKHLLHSV